MQKIILIAFVLFLGSCKKEQPAPGIPSFTYFFETPEEAFDMTKKQVAFFTPERQLIAINSISYAHSGKEAYAIVFYTTDAGVDNIAFKKEIINQQMFGTSIKCEGSQCECKVRTVFEPGGGINVSCNCSSCTMKINEVDEPER